MPRELKQTGDGSHTLYDRQFKATYHSSYGARQESEHVFIASGLQYFSEKYPSSSSIRILEMGFGTGLNAWLSWNYARGHSRLIEYHAIEAYPVGKDLWEALNYPDSKEARARFEALHVCEWNMVHALDDSFHFCKYHTALHAFRSEESFDIVYYDAFGPGAQPELWTLEAFEVIASRLRKGGVLTTYCSKGTVRRTLESLGFNIEKLPGPPGKREIVRAHFRPSGAYL